MADRFVGWNMAEEQGLEQSKPKIDFKKILTIAAVVLNFAVVGAGAYAVYAGTLGHHRPTDRDADLDAEMVKLREMLDKAPIMYAMDSFNTNLDGFPRRFLRLEMSVEMYDNEGFEELVTLGGESRDAIMRILNGKKFEDLETIQGKLHLKNDIVSHLNGALKRGVVKNVYFTKLQVQ